MFTLSATTDTSQKSVNLSSGRRPEHWECLIIDLDEEDGDELAYHWLRQAGSLFG